MLKWQIPVKLTIAFFILRFQENEEQAVLLKSQKRSEREKMKGFHEGQ